MKKLKNSLKTIKIDIENKQIIYKKFKKSCDSSFKELNIINALVTGQYKRRTYTKRKEYTRVSNEKNYSDEKQRQLQEEVNTPK